VLRQFQPTSVFRAGIYLVILGLIIFGISLATSSYGTFASFAFFFGVIAGAIGVLLAIIGLVSKVIRKSRSKTPLGEGSQEMMVKKNKLGSVFIAGAITAASGVVIAILALIFNAVTADDGTGANIGAGLLLFLGVAAAVVGVLLAVAGIIEYRVRVRRLTM
jgi:hypothetical protein